MPALTAADLRAAALSDHRAGHSGMLDMFLPDVPGEPFGGIATAAQREAVTQATGRYVPPVLSHGKDTRPQHLRALLRAWAERQPSTAPVAVTVETADHTHQEQDAPDAEQHSHPRTGWERDPWPQLARDILDDNRPALLARLDPSVEPARPTCAERGHPIADDDYVCECGSVYTEPWVR